MRTLPLRLTPVAGESLPGYVARYSHTFGIHPGDVFHALGLEDPAGRVAGAGCYGVWLSPEQLARVSLVTGIDSDQLNSMLLARYADRLFPDPHSRGRSGCGARRSLEKRRSGALASAPAASQATAGGDCVGSSAGASSACAIASSCGTGALGAAG